jgi:hypothetical protein
LRWRIWVRSDRAPVLATFIVVLANALFRSQRTEPT